MTNTNIEHCEETHKDGWMCCYPRHHRGDHKAWGANKAKPYATWPQKYSIPFAKGGFESPHLNCTSTHNIPNGPAQGMPIVCQLKAGHPGSHLKTFLTRDTVTWKDEPKVSESEKRWYFHSGRGWGKTASLEQLRLDMDAWEVETRKKLDDVQARLKEITASMETPVLLTVEELKVITYAIIGLEEDEPELVAKIDKALKDAL